VELEVTCDLTLNLLERFHLGHFDLVLVKRQPMLDRQDGVRVWREPLVWVGATSRQSAADFARVPLVVSPEPCVYRKRATEAPRRWPSLAHCLYLDQPGRQSRPCAPGWG
jgi:DNA-binding transcriptional LysR family regulator